MAMPCRVLLILATFLTFAAAPLPAPAQQNKPTETPARTPTEQWVWDKAKAGDVADLNYNENCPFSDRLNRRNKDDVRWNDKCRAVSAAFIRRVLTEER